MAPRVQRGRIILRHWSDESGLHETEESFATLNELFALCLQTRYPMLVDRVIIEGVDEEGQAHSTMLIFQSVSVSGTAEE
jgi:hypothetical protein